MESLSLLADLLARARAAGADAADAVFLTGSSVNVERRLGKIEHLERSEGRDLGLRVFLGKRSAIASSSALEPREFDALAQRAVEMAKVVPEDEHAGLAGEAAIATGPLDAAGLDLDDPAEPDVASLLARAAEAEDAALAVHGVTNSEGASAGYGRSEIVLLTSAGFAGRYFRSSHSISATALAGEGMGMQRDYDYSTVVHLPDLESPHKIGRLAGERAVTRLNPTRPRTSRLPVVFDPRVATSLLGHLMGAINGASVARGTTFLRDRLGERVFAPGILVVDDPLRIRGLRSRPFDGEGVRGGRIALVEDGVLTTWLLDTRSARQLGLRTNGRAGRGTGGPPSPSPTNLHLAAGTSTPAELMADITEGLYVTELIGMGVNGVTGDYSRGAAGFMIRNGAIAEPVAEITIAGRLQDMFARLVPANDLEFRRGTDAPTVRIDDMTLAGA